MKRVEDTPGDYYGPGAYHFRGSNLPDERIWALAGAVRASFGEDDSEQLRVAVREYVSESRFGRPGSTSDARRVGADERQQKKRHERMAEIADELVELMRAEVAVGGPMHTSLAAKLGSLDVAGPLPSWERSFKVFAAVARHTFIPDERSPKTDPRKNPNLDRLIKRVAKVCRDAGATLYGKPRSAAWGAANTNRASSLAEGIVALLAELPPDVALNRSASALAEYIRRYRLLTSQGRSGHKSAKHARKK